MVDFEANGVCFLAGGGVGAVCEEIRELRVDLFDEKG